ncbi:LuxR family transcriptional regulator [Methylosinus sp. C49]|uniref:helix-turn-helix transcriptional regulator n=1 Tax=Methylosinus sp. C49 TaxID=2699395 RepID=UPI001366B52E|nr:helix-turn-helix transcriptional regulator [Methylosinus sp. C49]BBU62312.1 LuxR family transcriptional regulator [Methylosinus sp. C49]
MIDFENLVELIYRAATDPDLWPLAMHELAASTEAAGGIILTRRSDAWVGWRHSTAMVGIDDYLRSPAGARSQAPVRLLAADHAGFLDAETAITPEEWLADPVMTHWGTPNGLPHAAATAMPMPTGDFVVVHISRRIGQPAFAAVDIAHLDAFRPHLARAGFLAARWRLERLRAATEALALIGLPAAALDARGRALAANSLIEKMTTHVLWLPDDRVALADSAANGMLRRALVDVSRLAATTARSFPARGRDGHAAVVHLIPMAGESRDLFDGGCALLVVAPVALQHAPDAAVIRGLFDLTAAEACVASGIVSGLSLEQIAKRQGTAPATVRSQLKSVLAKTGVGRQSSLVALLASQLRPPYPTKE